MTTPTWPASSSAAWVKGFEAYETGYGIAPYPCDNEHDWLVVDCSKQTVSRTDRASSDPLTAPVIASWSFERFTEIDVSQELEDY